LAVLGVAFKAHLARQALYHLSHTPAFFALVIFDIESHFLPELAWISILLFMFPAIAGMTGMYHHKQVLVEMRSHELLPSHTQWPQTVIFPISAFSVSSITGMSHCTRCFSEIF
jgi:hypothetical protein